ncbi:hypothetical protein DFJ77DRAFT_455752 [Powellomyces hirtus]|nr:hypothetical protein DFJ77DRAFT_455752 [Powellomyces hirtus]
MDNSAPHRTPLEEHEFQSMFDNTCTHVLPASRDIKTFKNTPYYAFSALPKKLVTDLSTGAHLGIISSQPLPAPGANASGKLQYTLVPITLLDNLIEVPAKDGDGSEIVEIETDAETGTETETETEMETETETETETGMETETDWDTKADASAIDSDESTSDFFSE